MKRIFLLACLSFPVLSMLAQAKKDSTSIDSFFTLSPVEVRAVRASAEAPFAKTNITKAEVVKSNLGQDLPFLLSQTPSVVINADAGNGVGYTGIRIRGTDASRINVTLNGIPYNDAESQGTFFVDLPDFASSVGSIQVLRGVGTSSNGSGAYGASINFSTNEINASHYVELNNSIGSFNTWKNTLLVGTGLINGFTADARLSGISSDGFIDRASSRLRSGMISIAKIGKKNTLRLNFFSGHEKTYQAWYGISEADLLSGHRKVNYAGTEKPGDPYDNETDNYTQTHLQLFFTHVFSERLILNAALFSTWGKGYYQQYKADQDYADYGLPYPVSGIDTTYRSDFVRQLWLDNQYYGGTFGFHYTKGKSRITLGGSATEYDGAHYGTLIWASKFLQGPYDYYDLNAYKSDLTVYLKEQSPITQKLSYYYDLQYRRVVYGINGFPDNKSLIIRKYYNFFNPKAGLSYKSGKWNGFLSFAVANKEPNRDDFEAERYQQPKPETLYDWEAGFSKSTRKNYWAITVFYMDYKNQLVLTGKINDVGAYTRTNIARSYRAGLELEGKIILNKWLQASGNMAFSNNKVKNFTEYLDDYDNGGQQVIQHHSTDISLSPSVVGNTTISIAPAKNLELFFINKYVSRQFLDNTSNKDRSLDPYFTEDLSVNLLLRCRWVKELRIIGRANNLFNELYEPNGYTYSYIYGGATTTENYYFPMAGINYMLALNFRW
jgi:iron complex outermembrane receptor protein